MLDQDDGRPDQWRVSDERLAEVVSVMAAEAASLVHQIWAWDDENAVDSPNLMGCEVYSALQTDEHNDESFPRWTVLLVLRTNGHSVTTNDGAVTMTPAVSDLLLFDLHQIHVLNLPDAASPTDENDWWTPEHTAACCRDYPFVCAHIDVEDRPTREEAESLLLAQLEPALSYQVEAIGQPGPR